MFSIIVPSYNRKNDIPYLLENLEHQTVYNFEVIIVDDCSVEPVELSQFYPFPVNIIRNQTNLGASESRNVGAKMAKYEWLLFLDDDDRFLPEKCAKLAEAIEQDPSINFIYHPAECVMVNEEFTYFTRPYQNEQDITLENILKANKIGGMPMIAIQKAFFEQVNGLSCDLHSLEDYEFLLKLIVSGNLRAKYIDLALTRCAFHTKRASVSTNTQNTESAIAYIQQKYIKTAEQAKNFKVNSLYMLAYPNIMHLSRKAGYYYLAMFKQTGQLKYLVVALITYCSPKWAINLKRFI